MLRCYIVDVINTCRGVVVDYKVEMDESFESKPECGGQALEVDRKVRGGGL